MTTSKETFRFNSLAILPFLLLIVSAWAFGPFIWPELPPYAEKLWPWAVMVIIAFFAGGERASVGAGYTLIFCGVLLAVLGILTPLQSRDFPDFDPDMAGIIAFTGVFGGVLLGAAGWMMMRRSAYADGSALHELAAGTDIAALKEFAAVYDLRLAPWMAAQETRRLTLRRYRMFVWLAGIPITGGITLLFPSLIVTFLATAALGGVAQCPFLLLRREMKQRVLTELCALLHLSHMSVATDFNFEGFRACGLVPAYDKAELRDMFTGTCHAVSFAMAGGRLRERENNGYDTVFHGVFIAIEFPQRFSGHTRLRRDMGRVGNWVERAGTEEKRVNLVYPEFEALFEVYATDQVEARAILTPDILESLVLLSDLVAEGKGFEAAFVNGRLLIAARTFRPLFEIGDFDRPMTDTRRIRKFVEEIALVHRIIEVMNLKLKAQKTRLC